MIREDVARFFDGDASEQRRAPDLEERSPLDLSVPEPAPSPTIH